MYGAHAVTAEEPPAEGEFDGIVHLVAPDAPPVLPDVFPAYQRVLAGNPRWVLAAGASAGLRGFFRSLAQMFPDTVARVVEQAPGTAPEDIAAELVAELTAPDHEPVVLRSPAHGVDCAWPRTAWSARQRGHGAGRGRCGQEGRRSAWTPTRSSCWWAAPGGSPPVRRDAGRREPLPDRTVRPHRPARGREEPALAAAGTAGELRSALIAGGLRVPVDRAGGRPDPGRTRGARQACAHSPRSARGPLPHRGRAGRRRRARAVKEIHAEHGGSTASCTRRV